MPDEVAELDGTVVFVNEPHPVPTRSPAFLIPHDPPPIREHEKAFAEPCFAEESRPDRPAGKT